GTAVLVRLRLAGPARVGDVTVAGVSVARHGETVCGDAWSWTAGPDGWSVLVADRLGPGPGGGPAAAAEAVRAYQAHAGAPPADILAAAHAAMRHTRGAALGIAEVRPTRSE